MKISDFDEENRGKKISLQTLFCSVLNYSLVGVEVPFRLDHLVGTQLLTDLELLRVVFYVP